MANLTLESGLLTVGEAAELLRLRPSTIRDWILKRRVPFVKLSRRVFLRRGDVEALIEASIVPASPSRVKREKMVSYKA